jgi:sugar phosphate permease
MTASHERRTLIIVSLALFMVVLDNLVVSVALASIHRDFGSSVQSLEWTVNAYTLCYAVFLLTGATFGDRFGRRRMFVLGLSIFTAASAVAGLAPNTGILIAARAVQGIGAAMVTPLTLTLLAETFPPERRGLALGIWSGHQRYRGRPRTACRRRGDRRPELALDLRHQRADRSCARAGRVAQPRREPRAQLEARYSGPGA